MQASAAVVLDRIAGAAADGLAGEAVVEVVLVGRAGQRGAGAADGEQLVALHAVRGTSTKDIAALLHLTVPTVQQHLTAPTVQQHVGAILDKTGTRTRRELVTLLMAGHLPTLGLPPA